VGMGIILLVICSPYEGMEIWGCNGVVGERAA
jgi:hypothetical protein